MAGSLTTTANAPASSASRAWLHPCTRPSQNTGVSPATATASRTKSRSGPSVFFAPGRITGHGGGNDIHARGNSTMHVVHHRNRP